MKKINFSYLNHHIILSCLFCIILLLSCNNKQNTKKGNTTPTNNDAGIEFKENNFNLGNITEGEIIAHNFYFKNTGKSNLIIKKIETSCGCTTVDYDKEPIPPGKEGKIEIEFNSSNRSGKQYKEIRIFANIPEKEVTLNFTANVKPKENE